MDDHRGSPPGSPPTAAITDKLPPPLPPTSDPKNGNKRCDYCQKECLTRLRCKRCRGAHYCSKTCQKGDWKIHKRVCVPYGGDGNENDRKKKPTVIEAARELSALIGGLSIEDATKQYHKANDEVKRLVSGTELGIGDGGTDKSVCGTNDNPTADLPVFGPPRPGTITTEEEAKETPPQRNSSSDTIRTNIPVEDTAVPKPTDSSTTNTVEKSVEQMSISCVSTQCAFAIEELVAISTLGFTLVLPQEDDAPSNLPFGGALFSPEPKAPNLRTEDIGLRIEPISPKTNGTNHHEQGCSIVVLVSRPEWKRPMVGSPLTTEREVADGNVLASFVLDKRITTSTEEAEASLSIVDGHYLTFRLRYSNDNWGELDGSVLDSIASETKLSDLGVLSNLHCRFCEQSLQQTKLYSAEEMSDNSEGIENGTSTNRIRDVLRLTAGIWDEITDYLVCYEGQATVDFSSSATTALRGIALEDECTLVLHRLNVPNVCVLAVEGYGENDAVEFGDSAYRSSQTDESEKSPAPQPPPPPPTTTTQRKGDGATYRGSREWKDHAGGGATVCCANCCVVLGYASLEREDTFRLWKHRLRAGPEVTRILKNDPLMYHTCASFVGREIVRYAESQAVYTICVVARDVFGESRFDSGHVGRHREKRRCLLLRLISWNTKVALDCNFREKQGKKNINDRSNTLGFRRIVKLIYEETNDMVGSSSDFASTNPSDWIWGGADLCCLPQNNTKRASQLYTNGRGDDGREKPNKASARIYLEKDEWAELKESLRVGATYFSASLSKTTVSLKMGRNRDYKNAFLSMLHLP